MLTSLTIKNYALIRHLELSPSSRLNVVTGETGAGKSIMLGAIGLLMGNRAESKVLWDEEEKCVTEAIFSIGKYKLQSLFKAEDLDYDESTVFRREISPGGKSRAFINDTPVTLEVMKRLGSQLMDIHSQHETLQLGQQSFQLRLVDAYSENALLLEKYSAQWSQYLKTKKELESLQAQADTLREEADYTNFQLEELLKANFEEREQDALESELKISEHAEEIKNRFQQIMEVLSNSEFAATKSLADGRSNLHAVSEYATQYAALSQRLDSLVIELQDILNEIEKEESKIEFDPERSEFVKERLSALYRLLKKHKANDIRELLTIQEALEKKNSLTSNLDEALSQSRSAFEQAEKDARLTATKLSDARAKSFKPLCAQLEKLLQELGIPNALLKIESQSTELSPTGIDRIEILFSANKGVNPRPLAQVASGGEFSRLMFCIKYVMAEKTSMPTLILDEIDSGVSGEVAIKLGNMMKAMSKKHQLITISHLPQIAGKGDDHYFVFKDNAGTKTITQIKKLTDDERVEEIAKMIGGAKPSKVARENAQEMLR